jgi:CelD/BcsL family acetyltransferase involved in cellulose biosynthesis
MLAGGQGIFPVAEKPRPGSGFHVLGSGELEAWRALVEEAGQSDWYQLPELWRHAEEQGVGTARLFVYREAGCFVALPLLLRPLREVPGLEGCGEMDAVSVGDYAGPMASRQDLPASLIRGFQEALVAEMKRLGVIFVFSKLNPMLAQEDVLKGMGGTHFAQPTVSIDLTLPGREQFRSYRPRLQSYLRRAWREGQEGCELDYAEHIGECLDMYRETMDRVGAADAFRYPDTLHRTMREALGGRLHLFGVRCGGRMVATSLFTEWKGIVQGFISCVRTEALPLSPARVMYDYIRCWAMERGCHTLHLGGGTSPRLDNPLFLFKAGFGDRRHEFRTWRWVVDPAAYEGACLRRSRWNLRHGLVPVRPDFFPEYRCATKEAE